MYLEKEGLFMIIFLAGFIVGFIITCLGHFFAEMSDYYHYKTERKRKEAYQIRYQEEKDKE